MVAAVQALKPIAEIDSLRLAGARVMLRRPQMADAARIAELMNDYGVVKNLSRAPWPYGLEDAVSWLTHVTGHGGRPNDYPFAIVTGDGLVGVIGISANPQNPDAPELGYWLGRFYWGRGFATEAGRLALGFAFDELELDAVEAGHFADNAASGRVLQKLGFAYTQDVARFSRARDCDVTCRMMILPRTRFEADPKTGNGGAAHGG
jgi:RimJ/RimL family protein N-acetyltransferase